MMLRRRLYRYELTTTTFSCRSNFFLPKSHRPSTTRRQYDNSKMNGTNILTLSILRFVSNPTHESFFQTKRNYFRPLAGTLQESSLNPTLNSLVAKHSSRIHRTNNNKSNTRHRPPIRDRGGTRRRSSKRSRITSRENISRRNIRTLLMNLLTITNLPNDVPITNNVNILPRGTPSSLRPTRGLLRLLNMTHRLRKGDISKNFRPLVRLPKRSRQQRNRGRSNHRRRQTSMGMRPRHARRSTTPRYSIRRKRVVIIMRNTRINNRRKRVNYITLPLVLKRQTTRRPLRSLSPCLLRNATNRFYGKTTTRPFRGPTNRNSRRRRPRVTRHLLLTLKISRPLRLRIFRQHRGKCHHYGRHRRRRLRPIISRMIISHLVFRGRCPLCVPGNLLPPYEV